MVLNIEMVWSIKGVNSLTVRTVSDVPGNLAASIRRISSTMVGMLEVVAVDGDGCYLLGTAAKRQIPGCLVAHDHVGIVHFLDPWLSAPMT